MLYYVMQGISHLYMTYINTVVIVWLLLWRNAKLQNTTTSTCL